MDSKRTVLLAILVATILVAVAVGCSVSIKDSSSNDSNDVSDSSAFRADVCKMNATAGGAVVGATNDMATQGWFIGKVFEKEDGTVVCIDLVYSLSPGYVTYLGPMYKAGSTTVVNGGGQFKGTYVDFQKYVTDNACEWGLPGFEIGKTYPVQPDAFAISIPEVILTV